MTQAVTINANAKRYPLAPNGVFWTINGEAHLRGFQMVFLRLAGCSVGCPECDTEYSVAERDTAEQIAMRCHEATPKDARDRWVWITGGEPTDHDLRPLLGALKARNFSTALASSGHQRIIPPVDWLSISPHDPSKWRQLYGNEVKLVPGLNGFSIADFRTAYPDHVTDFMYRYVQPVWRDGGEDASSVRECIEFLQGEPNWSLSRQDHKWWVVP